MAAPTFVAAGTGVVVTTGSSSVTKAGVTIGNFIMAQVLVDAGAVTALTLTTSGGSIEDLAGTDNALTVVERYSFDATSGAQLSCGRALATTVTVTAATTGADLYCRVYEFANVNTGTTIGAVLENRTEPEGSGTSIPDTGVTTAGSDRLACNWVFMDDDATLPAFTGQTGGTWVDAAQFASATGTDGAITLQTAAMPTAGTINGGTATASVTVNWTNAGLALIGTTVASTFIDLGPQEALQAVNRSSVW